MDSSAHRARQRFYAAVRTFTAAAFSFILNEPATATLNFTQPRAGRSVHGRCVAPSHANRGKPRCTRTVVIATLTLATHAGTNKVRFAGRVSRQRKLALGRYTLQVFATNSLQKRSGQRSIRFPIVG